MNVVYHPSPNFENRPSEISVDMLVLHYTGMASSELALRRLCDLASKVSAHYLIDEEGVLYHLVDEEVQAWHAIGLKNGGTTCEDPPGIRINGKFKIYLAYMRDPVGNKLCAAYLLPKE